MTTLRDLTTLGLSPVAVEFYRNAIDILNNASVPFLVGGAYALTRYTGIERHTRDFDVFLRRKNCSQAMKALAMAGYKTELTFPHWLAKAYHGGNYLDMIFSSGNAVCVVDDDWFRYSTNAIVLDRHVKLVSPEEMIWAKLFIMERERFDGADVLHLIRACAIIFDWHRLLKRVGDNWRLLLSHLIMFGYVYPGERSKLPAWVLDDLLTRVAQDASAQPAHDVCYGTLLSRAQYLVDVEKMGFTDARLKPQGNMTEDEITIWTQPVRDAAA